MLSIMSHCRLTDWGLGGGLPTHFLGVIFTLLKATQALKKGFVTLLPFSYSSLTYTNFNDRKSQIMELETLGD